VAQEALVYARGHLHQLRDPSRLRPWVRTIAARGATRARLSTRQTLEVEPSFVPLDADLGIDASTAISRLPLRERQAVILVYGLGYPNGEAATMFGISAGALGASLWKARRRLARELAGYGPEGR
jgi:DNA-directed RNA polymerase specialized sigma24 family protein